MVRGSNRAKAPRFVIDGGDTCGRRYLLEDFVVVLLIVLGFWVKTFVLFRLESGDA